MKFTPQIQITDDFILQKTTNQDLDEYMALYLRHIKDCFFDYDFEQSGLKKAPFQKQKEYFQKRLNEDITNWNTNLGFTYLLFFQKHVVGIFRLYWWEEKPWIGRNHKGQFQKGPEKMWMIGIYTDQNENIRPLFKANDITKTCLIALMKEALKNQIEAVTICTREDNLKALNFIKKFKIDIHSGIFCHPNAWGDHKRWIYIQTKSQDFI